MGGGVGGLKRGPIKRRLGGVEELFILVSSVQRSYSVEGMEQFFFNLSLAMMSATCARKKTNFTCTSLCLFSEEKYDFILLLGHFIFRLIRYLIDLRYAKQMTVKYYTLFSVLYIELLLSQYYRF